MRRHTEVTGLFRVRAGQAVGEHFKCCEGSPARGTGAFGRENVGTSNHKQGENPCRRKPKVSLAMTIIQGLVGPKAMAKAAADGQLVNIPALWCISMAGRSEVYRAYYWIYVCGVRMERRQIRAQAL